MDGRGSKTQLRLPTTSEFMASPHEEPWSPGGGTERDFSFSARHLSASEVVADILHEHGANILIHCALIRSRDRITREILTDALKKLAAFQPALWMKIDSDSANSVRRRVTRRFTEMSDDDRVVDVTIVPATETAPWQQVAEAELSKKFDSQRGPLWKVIYVESGDHRGKETSANGKKCAAHARPKPKGFGGCCRGMLLFKIHHVIADGVSMLDLLLRQLVPMLNMAARYGSGNIIAPFQSPLTMVPPADESFIKKEQLSWTKRRLLRSASLRASQRSDASDVSGARPSEPLLRVGPADSRTPGSATGVIPVILTAAVTRRFMERCNRNGVGFDEAMLTAGATTLAVAAAYCHVDLHSDVVVCGRPVDLRRYHTLHTHYEPLGRWIASDTARLSAPRQPPTAERFWSDVRSVTASVNSNGCPWKSLGMYGEMARVLACSTDVTKHKMFRMHMEIETLHEDGERSNAGDPDDWVTMDEHYFVKSMSDVTPATMALAATMFRGRISCSVAFNSRWIPREFATKYAETLCWMIQHVTDPKVAFMTRLAKLPAYVRACKIRSSYA